MAQQLLVNFEAWPLMDSERFNMYTLGEYQENKECGLGAHTGDP